MLAIVSFNFQMASEAPNPMGGRSGSDAPSCLDTGAGGAAACRFYVLPDLELGLLGSEARALRLSAASSAHRTVSAGRSHHPWCGCVLRRLAASCRTRRGSA